MLTANHIILSTEKLTELESWASIYEDLSSAFDALPTNDIFSDSSSSPTAHEQIEDAFLLKERNKAYAASIVLLHWNREHCATTDAWIRHWLDEFEGKE